MRLAVLQLAALLTACVTTPRPDEQVAAAHAMVSQAHPMALPAFPIASNETAVGRQLNRRVEVVIAPPAGASAGGSRRR